LIPVDDARRPSIEKYVHGSSAVSMPVDPAYSSRDHDHDGLASRTARGQRLEAVETSATSPVTLAWGTPPVWRTSATTLVTRLSAI
jgi:hypothetical protein